MDLKMSEKLGGIAGFIPIVSTFTGAIKYFYYRNKAQKADSQPVTNTAQKVKNVQERLNIGVKPNTSNACYEKLAKASLVEMIPIVNIFAAIYSSVVLSKLSDIRESNDPVRAIA